LLAALERLRALALARLVAVTTNARPDRVDADSLDELRHLTPLQVAELLNLREAYVHELCRSSQMPAVKRGKYWMIPVVGLREWLTRSRRPIDPSRLNSLASCAPAPGTSGAGVEVMRKLKRNHQPRNTVPLS
jgi:hypothetical protein